ncbi:ribonuclease T2 [Lichenihabitans psoromatis]|uniref:ribonuclease T2 n=1 Tax=Lichenihabitans psoromatis TaxID=2528642 RepID=UPI001FDFDD5F|nr:ribonuclease T2 [Lichenihabitans psoromatis]
MLDKCLNGSSDQSAAAPASTSRPVQTGSSFGGSGRSRQPGVFDFYVLALSWSPGFCDTGGDNKAPRQCATGSNLGFVVHGLWPQYTRGFPSDCDSGNTSPTRAALDSVNGVYPDVGLARYEWRKHGTCTGLSPTDYFALVRRARDAVTIPTTLQSPSEPQTAAPLEIARAFTASNPGLRTDMMAVTCRQDELQEVRICFGKDLRGFVTCPEVSRAACRTQQITILPVR